MSSRPRSPSSTPKGLSTGCRCGVSRASSTPGRCRCTATWRAARSCSTWCLDGMAAESRLPEPSAEWRSDVAAIAGAVRAALLKRRDLTLLLTARLGRGTPPCSASTERSASSCGAGFHAARRRSRSNHALGMYVAGAAMWEAVGLDGEADPVGTRRSGRRLAARLGALPPGMVPEPGGGRGRAVRRVERRAVRLRTGGAHRGLRGAPGGDSRGRPWRGRLMRALVLERPGRLADGEPLRLRDVAEPAAGPGEVLIRVAACGVCRTDLQLVEGDLAAHRLPTIPGHQVVGRVEAVGDGVAGWSIGDRAGVGWLAGTCGTCGACGGGRENLCDAARFTAGTATAASPSAIAVQADFAPPDPDTVRRPGGGPAPLRGRHRLPRAPRVRGSSPVAGWGSTASGRRRCSHPGRAPLGLRGLRRDPLAARAGTRARPWGHRRSVATTTRRRRRSTPR